MSSEERGGVVKCKTYSRPDMHTGDASNEGKKKGGAER